MLEKTNLAETEFNSLVEDSAHTLRHEIGKLKEQLEELKSQIKWLELENSKYL